jgi:hypothetical protein
MTYRSEEYGDMFRFNIEDIKPGTIMTVDGEVGYHVEDGVVVYDSNGSELTTRHLWEIEDKFA